MAQLVCTNVNAAAALGAGFPTSVYMASADGTPTGNPIGYAVALPQCCACSRPGGINRDKTIYLTPEWMKEIIYVPAGTSAQDANSVLAALPTFRTANDAVVSGCAHISKSVFLTKVTFDVGNKIVETLQAGLYCAVVADGRPSTDFPSVFIASKIYVTSAPDWDKSNSGSPIYTLINTTIPQRPKPQPASICS